MFKIHTSNKIFKIIEFKGLSKTGKTESIESLVKYLKLKNIGVMAIKYIHMDDFSVDTPKKDTWRFSQAGADPVIAVSSTETALITKCKLSLPSIVKISQVVIEERKLNIDFIIAEGYYDGYAPLVLILKKIEDLTEILNMIFSCNNPEEILSKIMCISGALLGDIKNEAEFTTLNNDVYRIISEYVKAKKMSLKRDLNEKLKKISIINIKLNPDKFMALYNSLL